MKRALLVSTGTVAGLAAVLSYSSGETPVAIAADSGAAGGAGLGAPAPAVGAPAPVAQAAAPAAPTKAPSAKPAPTTAAAPTKAAAPAPTKAATKAPAASAAPTKAAAPAPTKAAAPAPAPTKAAPPPAPAKPSGDFLGAGVTYKYGTLQVGIRVKDGKIVDAWAAKFPMGDSQPYSEMAMPILRQQTVAAQSAKIAGATGASLTSNAWIASLSSAISKAGV